MRYMRDRVVSDAAMLRSCLAALVLLTAPASASEIDHGCGDLSGQYLLSGTWVLRSFEGVKPESIAAFAAADPSPRLDRFAFGILASQIVNPRVAILRHNPATGIVEIDIVGDSVQPKPEPSAPDLPVRLSLKCSGTDWLREHTTSGGGENVPSRRHEKIALRVEPNGDLVAEGHSDTTTGWIFKSKSVSDWLARFQRTIEHPDN